MNAAADVEYVFCLLGGGRGLTVHVQYECHHSSMFLIGGKRLVATVPCCDCPQSPLPPIRFFLEPSLYKGCVNYIASPRPLELHLHKPKPRPIHSAILC